MESSTNEVLVKELRRVREELLRKLEGHLESTSVEICKSLAKEMVSCTEKAIVILTHSSISEEDKRSRINPIAAGACCPNSAVTPSPRSLPGSPHSENSNRPGASKKRKTSPKCKSTQVKLLGTGPGAEGPLDDGHNWRKYGQKEILGAKYPRGYYRCTHRNSMGCQATKQVQRSEDNPSVFDVTYRGTHTCNRMAPSAFRDQELQQSQLDLQDHQHHYQNQHNQLQSFQSALKVKTEGLDSKTQDPTPSSFSFPSNFGGCVMPEDHIFSSSSTLDDGFMDSPSFLSPTTPESNYLWASSCPVSNYGGGLNLQTSESDLTETISAATSTTNSPLFEVDFMLDSVSLDLHLDFQMDPSFFSTP